MRTAFDVAVRFARTESPGGGPGPIIDRQPVGQALISARTRIEAVRALLWRAGHALDESAPSATALAAHAKIFGSDTAVAVITDLMRVVGVDSYSRAEPLGQLLRDALALSVLGGGNVGEGHRLLAQDLPIL